MRTLFSLSTTENTPSVLSCLQMRAWVSQLSVVKALRDRAIKWLHTSNGRTYMWFAGILKTLLTRKTGLSNDDMELVGWNAAEVSDEVHHEHWFLLLCWPCWDDVTGHNVNVGLLLVSLVLQCMCLKLIGHFRWTWNWERVQSCTPSQKWRGGGSVRGYIVLSVCWLIVDGVCTTCWFSCREKASITYNIQVEDEENDETFVLYFNGLQTVHDVSQVFNLSR